MGWSTHILKSKNDLLWIETQIDELRDFPFVLNSY